MSAHTFQECIRACVSYKRKFKRKPLQWVQEMTASDSVGILAVAKKLHMTDRGPITVGSRADLVVFDASKIRDLSTFTNPHQYPEGVPFVMVNGELAVRNGDHSGARSGSVLRRDV